MTRPEDLDGKYRLGRVLREGDRAVIIAATHLSLREPVIVKVLHADERDPRFAAKLRRAARQSALIRSPHVVRYFDVGHLTDQRPYVVMERLTGQTLADHILSRGPLDLEEATDVMLQTCEALACAHARGILHRDLSASNIFCTEQPDRRMMIKVLNFGTSRAVDASGDQEDQGMTVTALAVDAPDYKAPEQIVPHSKIGTRTDTWALGVILYEMLTGTRPFAAPTAQDTVRRILGAELTTSPRIPSDFWNIVRGCISLKREERWDSVATVADALAHAARAEMANYAVRVRQILETPVVDEAPLEDLEDEPKAVTAPLELQTKTLVLPSSADASARKQATIHQTESGLPRLNDGHDARDRSMPWMRMSKLGLLPNARQSESGRVGRILVWGSLLAVVIVVVALSPRMFAKLTSRRPMGEVVTSSTQASLPSSVGVVAAPPEAATTTTIAPPPATSGVNAESPKSTAEEPTPSSRKPTTRAPSTTKPRSSGEPDPFGWQR